MEFRALAEAFRSLEQSRSRREAVTTLVGLFRRTPAELLGAVVYLSLGKVAPDFAGVELGVAEKLAVRAVAAAAAADEEAVRELARESGDLGAAAELLLRGRRRHGGALEVAAVGSRLRAVAAASGTGAQARKLDGLCRLLEQATPLEARYLVRIVTGSLRTGAADATLLDALAEAFTGGRQARRTLERAYNLCSDLGHVADLLARSGLAALAALAVRPGRPVRPMLAQRAATAGEALERLGGRCAAEYKYDGERAQAHLAEGGIELYSRRAQSITGQFPDVAEALLVGLKARAAIVDGEVVALDAASGRPRPFQELMRRRRKHGADRAARLLPASFIAFDLLFVDGDDLTGQPYPRRRQRLADVLTSSDRLQLSVQAELTTEGALADFFEQALAAGCEGLVCKALGPESVYRAGARGWLWIKLKREYRSELRDTLDLVVVGAFHGRGARRGTYGSLLLAAYDDEQDAFRSLCRCGTGFSARDLSELRRRLAPLVRAARPARVDVRISPDVWIEPSLVLEVVGAGLTVSPSHTAAWADVRERAGLALRFPRFTGRFREDKRPEDATTVRELRELHRRAENTRLPS